MVKRGRMREGERERKRKNSSELGYIFRDGLYVTWCGEETLPSRLVRLVGAARTDWLPTTSIRPRCHVPSHANFPRADAVRLSSTIVLSFPLCPIVASFLPRLPLLLFPTRATTRLARAFAPPAPSLHLFSLLLLLHLLSSPLLSPTPYRLPVSFLLQPPEA